MTRKNEFPPRIRTLIAQRAGYKCCYLGCGQATIGPSKEKNNSDISFTGVAAHIYSASSGPGAKRKPTPEMTHEEIISLENAISMCQTHGKYIDDDEITFTVEELKRWKEVGEEVARKMQALRRSYIDALSELENSDPKISKMIAYAQKNDPSNDRYNTLDRLLYKKILEMLPDSVLSKARWGRFIHPHSEVPRDMINDYLYTTENNPVEYSFHDKKIQKCKEDMDELLRMLTDKLSLTTFPFMSDGKNYYHMSREWKETKEGLILYKKSQNEIIRLSTEFIKLFDQFYTLCRDKYLE